VAGAPGLYYAHFEADRPLMPTTNNLPSGLASKNHDGFFQAVSIFGYRAPGQVNDLVKSGFVPQDFFKLVD
jgi:hypothetical protein